MQAKFFKRIIVALASAAMLFGALSVFSFSQKNTAKAYSTASDNAVNAYMFVDSLNVDGLLKEPAWFIDNTLSIVSDTNAPTARAGFLWDATNLYVGISQSGAENVTLSVGGKQAVYDITASAWTENALNATAAKSGATLEVVVPFADMGVTLDGFGKCVAFDLSVANATGTARLAEDTEVCLNGSIIYSADSCDGYVDKQYTAIKSGAVTGVVQGDGYYLLKTAETASTVGFRNVPTFPSGDMEYVFNLKINELPVTNDRFSSGGFYINAWGYLEEFGFSLTKGSDGKIYANMLYDRWAGSGGYGWDGTTKQCLTSLSEGDTANIHLLYKGEKTNDGTSTVDVIINNQYVHTFKNLNAENPQWKQQLDIGVTNANSGSGKADVELIDFMIFRSQYSTDRSVATTLFEQEIPFAVFGTTNTKESRVMSDLELPTSVELPIIGSSVEINWSSNRTNVLSNTGAIVTRSATGNDVKLTASVVLGGKKYTYTYNLIVSGFDADGKVMFLEHDLDPYTGSLGEKGNTDVITLDTNLNSVGYDLGSVTNVNEILLKDSDGLSRLEKEDLSLYVSNDNVTYTRIKDWTLFHTSNGFIISNFNANCRYVKIHCHFENDEAAAFSAPQQSMINAYYNEAGLPGNNGGTFEKLLTIVSEAAEADDTDAVTYVAISLLYEYTSDCRGDLADIRFVQNGKVLAHYYDGDGFYIRIPETVTGSTVSIDVYGKNESALDISRMEGVFDAVYGNKTVYKLQFEKFNHNIAVGTAPNGDVLAIANWMSSIDNLLMIRSTDGGRTWSDSYTEILDMTNPINQGRNEGGGFLLDTEANDGNGRLFYYYYFVKSGQPTYARIIYTDDNGYNWSDPFEINKTTSGKLQNASSYSDGIKVSVADGEGPNVDYVFPAAHQVVGTTSFVSTAVYSKDGGETWLISDSEIGYYRGDEGYESGNSECAIAELSNGDLKIIMRCQYDGVYWYSQSVSHDYGVTWDENSTLSNIAAPNTMPVLKNEADGNIVLMWGGNNYMGGDSYRRYPMTLAYSDDDAETWKQKLNLFSQTSLEKYGDEAFGPKGSLIVQPSITATDYQGSDDVYISWWNFWYGDRGILVEDYHDMLYKTKGAADEFEINNARYEGWYGVWGNAYVTRETAKSGNGSLRIDDIGASEKSRANRSIPAMTKGTVSFDISFERLTSGFLIELKSAYVDNSDFGNMISAKIMSSGVVKDVNPMTREETTIGTISISDWINVTINFDMEQATAEILVDGVKIGDLSVNTDKQWGTSVTNVQLCDATYGQNQMIAYVDNFVAYTGVTLMNGKESDWTIVA